MTLNNESASAEAKEPIKFTIEDGSELQQLGTLLGMSKDDMTNLDWALVRITKREFRPTNNLLPELGDSFPKTPRIESGNDVPVRTSTGSQKASTGIMHSPLTLLKMAGSLAFQEVRTVILEGNIGK